MVTKQTNNSNTAHDKLNGWVGKVATFAISIVIVIGFTGYEQITQRITTLEDKVSFLSQDKVSRAEFREEMLQLRLQNDANKADIVGRQDSMKSDMLSRLDLILRNTNAK